MFGWYISQFTCHWQMGQKVNSGFLAPAVRHHGLQQASKHQMAEFAWWMQQGYSSWQAALYHSVITTLPMFALLTDQKKKGPDSQPWIPSFHVVRYLQSCPSFFNFNIYFFLVLCDSLEGRRNFCIMEMNDLAAKHIFDTGHQNNLLTIQSTDVCICLLKLLGRLENFWRKDKSRIKQLV